MQVQFPAKLFQSWSQSFKIYTYNSTAGAFFKIQEKKCFRNALGYSQYCVIFDVTHDRIIGSWINSFIAYDHELQRNK
jgi:hypothetical protein